ncbi:MAG TPA: glycosyltransferase [Candidatus Eisenbacteria bacterium]|nr:glycosyltransferase [Candidatus Eisenbacteria bacterium]
MNATEGVPPALAGLRVALVHDWLTGMRGGEKCLEVLAEIFPAADLYTLVHRKGTVAPVIESRRVTESFIARLPGGRKHYRWYAPFFPFAIETFDLTGYDLVVSTSHCVAKGAVTRADTLHVCYCFTPVRYFWDLYPDYFGPGKGSRVSRATAPLLAHYYRLWDRVSADRVDLFLADSAHVRDRIAKHYRRRSRVVHPPVDTSGFVPAAIAAGADAPYLVVSALVPYKGVERTIRVCAARGVPLRIVGTGPDESRLRAMAGSGVRFDGWLSAEALRDAYRECRALIQAHEEDFGIAPVEALAAGRPVVALRKGGASEVVTPECGVLYDDPTDAGLSAALDRFEARSFAAAALRARSLEFSRDAYRSRMTESLTRAWELFRARAGAPFPLDAMAD